MKVRDARFLLATTDPGAWPKVPRPEIAFAGRSNVGKSSLINALLGRRALARTSSKPGKTRALGFIDVDAGVGGRMRFCDLPGYGFARVSKAERAAWGRLIERYVQEREVLRLVVCLVDARHPPGDLDRQMVSWLRSLGRPLQVVATKVDKVPRTRRKKALQVIEEALEAQLLAVSSQAGEGLAELWRVLLAAASE